MRNWLTFKLAADELYACRLDEVKEVVDFQNPVPVPGASAKVEGLVYLRGEIIPIVSLARVLEMGQINAKYILVQETISGLVGIPVTELGRIIELDNRDLNLAAQSNSLVLGTVNTEKGLLVLLDLNLQCI